jgi:hypothetical protein
MFSCADQDCALSNDVWHMRMRILTVSFSFLNDKLVFIVYSELHILLLTIYPLNQLQRYGGVENIINPASTRVAKSMYQEWFHVYGFFPVSKHSDFYLHFLLHVFTFLQPFSQHRLLVRDEKYPHIVHVDRGITNSNETEVNANLYDPEGMVNFCCLLFT